MARRNSSRRGANGSTRNNRSRRPAVRRGSSWWVRLLALALLFTLGVGAYLASLDHDVRTKFEGKRWALPARVYARALELYPMADISAAQFARELARLGYQRTEHPRIPGDYSVSGGHFVVHTRGFEFWDATEPARTLDLQFDGGVLRELHDGATGATLPLVRLEPPLVGSIYPASNEDRVLVRRQDLPDTLVKALIAVEDRNFYEHHGVDPRAIIRALWADVRSHSLVQGGSTLTQQLVKNFYLSDERTLVRKITEAAMAVLLELHYSKDEILEVYANEIFLGQDGPRAIHGFGLASQFYFNRPLDELDLAQQALLAALPRGPSYYDPRRHPGRAHERRDLVLDLMVEQGYITAQQAAKAKAEPLGVSAVKGQGRGRYPAFMDLVRRQLHRDYREDDLTSEGLRIFTTLDPAVQDEAEVRMAEGLTRLEAGHHMGGEVLEGAAVVVDSQSGEILCVVGGRDARYAGFNRAVEAVRPIGSLVKPAVYLTALSRPKEYSLTTLVDDSEIRVPGPAGKVWAPKNYDRREHGRVTVEDALAHSYNQATVRIGMDIGVDAVADTLRALGVARPFDAYPSLLLGAIAISPLEVAQVYQTLAAGGFTSPLRAIREVMTHDGKPLQRYPVTVHRSVPAGPVYLVTRAMQAVVTEGTGRSLSRYLPADLDLAGKTGTTDDLRDSWFAGFGGDKVAVVWVGRDDNKPAGLSGATGALRIWGAIMRDAGPKPLVLTPPDDIALVWIDPANGMLADESCPGARQEPFLAGGVPSLTSSCVGNRALNYLRRVLE